MPEMQAEIDRVTNLPLTIQNLGTFTFFLLPTRSHFLVAESKKDGLEVNMDGMRYPRIDEWFTKEDQEEVLQTPPLFNLNKM
jgi:hypothetical protein